MIRRRIFIGLLLAALTAIGSVSAVIASAPRASARAFSISDIRHVFVINLENKGFDEAFGAGSPAKYLNGTLRPRGQLLTQYFGVAHNSLPNYVAQISGQGPSPQTQADCQMYTNFVGAGITPEGQAIGQGCVYPKTVTTVADQLDARGLRWKAYMEDMSSPCLHPSVGTVDQTQQAKVGNQYAARHNPFVYFHSIIDTPECAQDVVPLRALSKDLQSTGSTPNLVYITPNLCDDGHDAPCVDGRPGGLVSADAWLAQWVPKILASPAYKRDGMLVVTFDESDFTDSADASACCGEGPGPNTPLPGIAGLGGGRVGAVVVSRWTRPGTTNGRPYNHYGLLRTIEDVFGLPHLGYANGSAVNSFGPDVFGGPK